jgi:hypothetical protein
MYIYCGVFWDPLTSLENILFADYETTISGSFFLNISNVSSEFIL